MHPRSTGPQDQLAFDEPADAHFTAPVTQAPRFNGVDENGFRALLDDPEACWQWEPSPA